MERTQLSRLGHKKNTSVLASAPYPPLRYIIAAIVVAVGLPLTIAWASLLGYLAFSLLY